MSSVPKEYLSPEQYLAIERAADQKSEYVDGVMFAMAGTSYAHVKIVSNIAFHMRSKLPAQCDVLTNDLRVRIPSTRAYVYPDIVLACGDLLFDDQEQDTLLNPSVIVEVLSGSTENWDRGGKFEHYRRIPSLTDYLLVSQEKIAVEHRHRQSESVWLMTEIERAHEIVSLEGLGIELRLSEIYQNVAFNTTE